MVFLAAIMPLPDIDADITPLRLPLRYLPLLIYVHAMVRYQYVFHAERFFMMPPFSLLRYITLFRRFAFFFMPAACCY